VELMRPLKMGRDAIKSLPRPLRVALGRIRLETPMAEGGNGNLSGLNEKERINIILEEYKALRAEVVARTTMQVQIYSVFGAGVITVIGLMVVYKIIIGGFIMLCLLSILSTIISVFLTVGIRNIAEHLLEIESEINRRAGERLFSWESKFGILQLGILSRRGTRPRPHA